MFNVQPTPTIVYQLFISWNEIAKLVKLEFWTDTYPLVSYDDTTLTSVELRTYTAARNIAMDVWLTRVVLSANAPQFSTRMLEMLKFVIRTNLSPALESLLQ